MTIEEDLTSLGRQAVKNIATTINQEVTKIGRAKKHQDSVSFEVLSRIGFGRKDMTKPTDPSGLGALQPELQKRLVEALENSAEATRIYDMPEEPIEVEVVDAPAE
jgi:hypothetical protein